MTCIRSLSKDHTLDKITFFCAYVLGVRVGRHTRGMFRGENGKRGKRDACTDCHDMFCASQDTL